MSLLRTAYLVAMVLVCGVAAAQNRSPAGDNVSIPTTPGQLLAAQPLALGISYKVMGVGPGGAAIYGCVSFVTAAISIDTSASPPTCLGAGAMRVTDGSTFGRFYPAPVPGSALTGVATATGLRFSYEVQ